MRSKPEPITLKRIAADVIHGTRVEMPATELEKVVRRVLLALPSRTGGETLLDDIDLDLAALLQKAGIPPLFATVSRADAQRAGGEINDAWGMIKSFDSTGTVTIQENAEGHWYAIWCDHAGAVIAESSAVTSPEQAEKLVLWMRDNAAAARQEILEGAYREALELAARAPTMPPPELAHLAPAPAAEENACG